MHKFLSLFSCWLLLSGEPSAALPDVLIDDSEGVRIEGERQGFRVLVVASDDVQWAEKVRAALESVVVNDGTLARDGKK